MPVFFASSLCYTVTALSVNMCCLDVGSVWWCDGQLAHLLSCRQIETVWCVSRPRCGRAWRRRKWWQERNWELGRKSGREIWCRRSEFLCSADCPECHRQVTLEQTKIKIFKNLAFQDSDECIDDKFGKFSRLWKAQEEHPYLKNLLAAGNISDDVCALGKSKWTA